MEKRGKDIRKITILAQMLVLFGEVPREYSPHRLQGVWEGVMECHIEHDWLLLYSVSETEVVLFRTGTHTDLFG